MIYRLVNDHRTHTHTHRHCRFCKCEMQAACVHSRWYTHFCRMQRKSRRMHEPCDALRSDRRASTYSFLSIAKTVVSSPPFSLLNPLLSPLLSSFSPLPLRWEKWKKWSTQSVADHIGCLCITPRPYNAEFCLRSHRYVTYWMFCAPKAKH